MLYPQQEHIQGEKDCWYYLVQFLLSRGFAPASWHFKLNSCVPELLSLNLQLESSCKHCVRTKPALHT